MTPYIAGQAAFKAGKPITDNPHAEDERIRPEDYPGPHACWAQGWRVAKWRREHREEIENGS